LVGSGWCDERAVIDRQQFPESDWQYYYYITLEHIPDDKWPQVVAALRFTTASTSTQPVIERCAPVEIGPGIYRIDCRELNWRGIGELLSREYPYRRTGLRGTGVPPLVIGADWFIQAALDQSKSDLYFTLLFGRVLEKQDEFLGFLGTSKDPTYRVGLIEENSGVSVAKVRLLESRPTERRVDTWITYDSAEINPESDPLQHLDNNFKFDAGEYIGALPKVSAATGDRGFLQVYALANSVGDIQSKAPTSLVVDHSGTRGVEIINPVSCIVCHSGGLNRPNTNGLRRLIESGVDVYAKDYDKIEAFHLGNIDKLIDRHNEDYGAIVTAITGMTPEETSACVKQVVQKYDKNVGLDAAALYFATTGEELSKAIAYASEYNKDLPVRVVSLAHGNDMPRTTFEEVYPVLYEVWEQWNSR